MRSRGSTPRKGVATARTTIQSFKENLEENPASALEWSQGAFSAAAELDLAGQALIWLERGASLEKVRANLLERALYNPGGSTSVPANHLELMRNRAAARFYRGLAPD